MLAQSDTVVFKVGGTFFEDSEAQKDLFSAFCMLRAQGKKLVLVHGGGNQVQELLAKLNFESTKHQGLRVTPQGHMPIVAGVLAGSLNKALVAAAKSQDIPAVGLSLADGEICHCTPVSQALGMVGQPEAIDGKLLTVLLNAQFVPVISSIGSDNQGNLYNVNADQAATCIAQLLNADLYLLSDVLGVLDAEKSLISTLAHSEAEKLIEQGVIKDGMTVKVKAAQEAANNLNKPVVVASWAVLSQLVSSKHRSVGTQILPND